MHSRETRVLLRHYLEQGVSKTELAKRFGISRRTVYHWIETGQLERRIELLRALQAQGIEIASSSPYSSALL